MKQLILLLILCIFVMCSPKNVVKMGDYTQLPQNAKLENYVHQKVTFVANRCQIEYQHMLKTSPDGIPTYICIEADEVGQILAYYGLNAQIENADNLRFRVFGTIGEISGAGKGGGTHTEYYLDLDNVEL